MNAQNLINRLVAKKLQSAGNTQQGRVFRQPQRSARAICVNEGNAGAIGKVRVACVWSEPTAR